MKIVAVTPVKYELVNVSYGGVPRFKYKRYSPIDWTDHMDSPICPDRTVRLERHYQEFINEA